MLDAALEYADLGYAVFPCAPGAKRPATANGLLDATTDWDQIEAWWTKTPEANIAIRTDGLVVLDFDPIDGRPNPWLRSSPERALELMVAPLSMTPRGGRHYVFRQPQGRRLGNTQSKLAPKVDTRADGGYILVAPSLVDGKAYQWVNPLDCPPDKLPEPPGWLLELLDASGERRPGERAVAAQPANRIPAGQRNAALTSLAGMMRRAGMSKEEIAAALHKANLDRCIPPLAEGEVETIAWSVARYAADQQATALVEHHAAQDGLAVEETTARYAHPGPIPDELLRVPGLIDELCAYNLAGAKKPQPVLALAGALALLSVLTGRKITDAPGENGLRTNLYIMGVGPSGCGKERARQVNKHVLATADAASLIGNENWASYQGIITSVSASPSVLFQVDEIGKILKTISRASDQQSHLAQIPSVLMSLFSSANNVFVGPAHADSRQNKTIHQPHAVIYGTTVPESLYHGMTRESVTDGFLSRMLIFPVNDPDPAPHRPQVGQMPTSIIRQVRWWYEYNPGGGNVRPEPRIVSFTEAATGLFDALEQYSRAQREGRYEGLETLWTRAEEKAKKLALIYACSDDREAPLVDIEAAFWACELTKHLTRYLLHVAHEYISENPLEAKRKRLLRAIAAAGVNGRTASELARSERWLNSRERLEILDLLILAGEVIERTVETGGRARHVYCAA